MSFTFSLVLVGLTLILVLSLSPRHHHHHHHHHSTIRTSFISCQSQSDHSSDDSFWNTIDIVKAPDAADKENAHENVLDSSEGLSEEATTGEILWRKGERDTLEEHTSMSSSASSSASSKDNADTPPPQKAHHYHNPSFDAEFEEFDDFPGTILEMDEVETEIVEKNLKSSTEGSGNTKQDGHADDDSKSTESKNAKRIFVIREQPHFYYELVFLVYFSVWIWFYILGKKRNESIGQAFSGRFSPKFVEQFYTTHDRGHMLFYKESASDYMYYASGRENCQGMSLDLSLRRRQDLLYSLYDLFLSDRPDRVIVSTALTRMDPFVFAVVRKSESKYYIEDHKDLGNLTAHPIPGLDLNFVYITDTPEIAQELLKAGLLEALKKRGHYIDSIHFSDLSHILFPDVSKRGVLRFEFRIPQKQSEWKHLDSLMELPFTYIDKIAQMQLPETVTKSTLEWRTNRNSEQQKGANALKKSKKASKAHKAHSIRQPKKLR